jgi:hypothetical protein
LDDIPKDEDIEGQTTWEENNLAPLEVVEEHVTMAPQGGRNKGNLNLLRVGGLDERHHTKGATFLATKMGLKGESLANQ